MNIATIEDYRTLKSELEDKIRDFEKDNCLYVYRLRVNRIQYLTGVPPTRGTRTIELYHYLPNLTVSDANHWAHDQLKEQEKKPGCFREPEKVTEILSVKRVCLNVSLSVESR